jgi:hypothetical protein
MAYSTGSGDYLDLFDAILTHAVADGWTEAGGVGTGWPISKGNVRGIDWSTYTATEDDVTIGGATGTKTQRYIRLGVGSSTGDATTDAAASPTIIPNMAYDFSEWHIFSDTSLCDYIHVVVKFNNGVNSDCYTHFSFGEVDKGGLTYGSIAYATCHAARGYAETLQSNTFSKDWNSLRETVNGWSGVIGEADSGTANITFMVNGTDAPTPDGSAGWPDHDEQITAGTNLWGKVFRQSFNTNDPNPDANGFQIGGVDQIGWYAEPPSQIGSITMMPLMFMMGNSTAGTVRYRFCGVFPDVRKCSMEGLSPGSEITYGSETWVIFPLVRNTPNSQLGESGVVTSGRAGIAFKKVA